MWSVRLATSCTGVWAAVCWKRFISTGLGHRLRKAHVRVDQRRPFKVHDEDGTVLGDYLADLFVDKRLLIVVKACRELKDEHTAITLGYLRGARIEHGLLINFGGARYQIRKFIWTATAHGQTE